MTSAILKTADQARAFALAGNATLTLLSTKTGARFTFKIQAPFKKDEEGVRDFDADIRFVKVLTGPDNETAYSYLGYIRRGVYFHGAGKARISAEALSAKAFAWTWQQLARDRMPEQVEIWHEGRCARCNRKLTVPSSIESGFGPECAGRVGFIAEAV